MPGKHDRTFILSAQTSRPECGRKEPVYIHDIEFKDYEVGRISGVMLMIPKQGKPLLFADAALYAHAGLAGTSVCLS